mmetsp:Transcript_27823/g.38130  ORF Transcript_27823/g.38130 Transcript_27823/m.38130 type:complete len:239 (-) Transcript_27823:286-1002(-)
MLKTNKRLLEEEEEEIMVTSLNLKYYLGSPALAYLSLRPQDQALFFERSNLVCDALHQSLSRLDTIRPPGTVERHHASVDVLCSDGYKGLRAATASLSHQRGLVLIDPPFQDGSDTDQAVRLIGHLHTHWRAARVMLWYPNGSKEASERLRREVKALNIGEVLVVELSITARETQEIPSEVGTTEEIPRPRRLSSSGVIIVQPPYRLKENLEESVLPRLGRLLAESPSDVVEHHVYFL